MPAPEIITGNTPVTAASITGAVGLLLANFTHLTAGQITAITGAVGLLAALAVQRWGTDPKETP